MRFLIVALFAIVLASGQAAHYSSLESERQARIFENEIRAYLACIQKNLNDGMPEVNLPPLNPFKADDISLELGKLAPELLSGNVHLQNVVLDGVAQWKFDRLKTSAVIFPPGFKADLKLVNPSITLNTDYDFDLTVKGQAVTGKGKISLAIESLSFDGNLQVSLTSGVKDFNVVVDVSKTDLTVTGLMNDDEFSKLVSEEVTNNLPKYLKDNAEEISKAIKDIVMKIVNKKQKSFLQINSKEINIDNILAEIKKRCSK